MKAKKKIERLQPVARVRKRELDVIAQQASQLELKINDTSLQLKASQDAYMKGVSHLNEIRTSESRSNLITLESSVDSLKEQWHSLYHKLTQLKRERDHISAQLRAAQKNLKAVEVLQDKYQQEFRQEVGRAEQRFQDEVAIRSYINRES